MEHAFWSPAVSVVVAAVVAVRSFPAGQVRGPTRADVEGFLVAEVRKKPLAGTTTTRLASAARTAFPDGHGDVTGGALFAALSRLEDRGEIRSRVTEGRRSTRRWFPCGGVRPKATARAPAGLAKAVA